MHAAGRRRHHRPGPRGGCRPRPARRRGPSVRMSAAPGAAAGSVLPRRDTASCWARLAHTNRSRWASGSSSVAGSAEYQRRSVATLRSRKYSFSCACAMAAAASTSPPAMRCSNALSGSPCSACHAPARRCRSVDGPRVLDPQLGSQQLREHCVVAVPRVFAALETDDQCVAALEVTQHPCAVVPAGHRVAERAGQPVEHGGLEQEPAPIVGLVVQRLLQQEVGDRLVVAP